MSIFIVDLDRPGVARQVGARDGATLVDRGKKANQIQRMIIARELLAS